MAELVDGLQRDRRASAAPRHRAEPRPAGSRAARAATPSACDAGIGRGRLGQVDRRRERPGGRPGPPHRRARPRGRGRLRGRPRPSAWTSASTASPCAASRCGWPAASTGWSTSSPSIADEITRVTREVGTEGKLGGQARVRSADGSWRDLIDAVNTMSSRLTDQVRDIATGDDGRRQRRPVAHGHRRGVRRDGPAEGHRRPDGRPAVVVRGRGDPRGPRGRHRGPPRRPGRRAAASPAPGRTSPTR